MTIIEQINQDLIEASKSQDAMSRDTLRLLKTALKNSEIAKGHQLSDEETIEVLAKEAKQRQEAETAFRQGNRAELADKEAGELAIIKKYLPAQLSDEEVKKLVSDAIAETGAQAMSDMGKVMGILMPKVKGKADASLVSQLVREHLS